ncbi:hypothetical protein HK096_002659 [Nowakowskiella sp. JEL0078]|nr:hypothetical protein HK096_002659 [Nowakowskiella sp. JEL0078]
MLLKSTLRYRPEELTKVEIASLHLFAHLSWENEKQWSHNIHYYLNFFYQAFLTETDFMHQYISLVYPKWDDDAVLDRSILGAFSAKDAVMKLEEMNHRNDINYVYGMKRKEKSVMKIGTKIESKIYPWMYLIVDDFVNGNKYMRPNIYEQLFFFLCRTPLLNVVQKFNNYRMKKQYPLSPQLYIDLLEYFVRYDSISDVLLIASEAKFNGLLSNDDFWVRYIEIRKSINVINIGSENDEEIGKTLRSQCKSLISEFENPIVVSSPKSVEKYALISPNLIHAYTIAVDLELRLKNFSRAKQYLSTMSKSVVSDSKHHSPIPIFTINNFLSASLEKSNSEMISAIEFLKELGLDIHEFGNSFTYNIIIKFCLETGDTNGALKLFDKLCEKYYTMKVKSVSEFRKTFKDSKITNFASFIPQLIGPNDDTLNLILNSLIGKASIPEINEIWKKALDCGVKPNLSCFSSMMGHFEIKNEPEAALNLLKKVRTNGIVPDTEMYSIAITSAMKLHVEATNNSIIKKPVEIKLPRSSIANPPSNLPIKSQQRIRHATAILSDMNAFKISSSQKVNLVLFSTLLELNDLPTSLHMLKLLYPLESTRLRNVPTILVTNVITLCSNHPRTGIELYELYGDYRIDCLKATLSNLVTKDINVRPEEVNWRKAEGMRLIEEYKSNVDSGVVTGNKLDFTGFGLMLKLKMMGWEIKDVQESDKMFWEFMATHHEVNTKKSFELKSNEEEDTDEDGSIIKTPKKETYQSFTQILANGVSVHEFILSIHSLMDGYAKFGDLRACMNVCEKAAEFIPEYKIFNSKHDLPFEINEHDIDVETKNIIMDAICRSIQLATSDTLKESLGERFEEIFNQSVLKHSVNDTTLCTYVKIHSFWKFENLDNAILLVRKVAKDMTLETITDSGAIGLPLNVYNSIIDAYAKTQRWDDIRNIIFEMLKADLPVLEKTIISIKSGPEGKDRDKCISFATVISGIASEFSME